MTDHLKEAALNLVDSLCDACLPYVNGEAKEMPDSCLEVCAAIIRREVDAERERILTEVAKHNLGTFIAEAIRKRGEK